MQPVMQFVVFLIRNKRKYFLSNIESTVNGPRYSWNADMSEALNFISLHDLDIIIGELAPQTSRTVVIMPKFIFDTLGYR